jgi:hypothetical protein
MSDSVTLILTNSDDVTSDYLQKKLEQAGLPVARYDTNVDLTNTSFSYSPVGGSLMTWGGYCLRPEEINGVIFRRPKPFEPALDVDEYHSKHIAGEWSEVWEGFLAQVPFDRWINHPSRNFMASHKIDQLSEARKYGLSIPETIVTSNPEQAMDFVNQQENAAIVKPLASGFIERANPEEDTSIYTRTLSDNRVHLLEKIHSCPVLIQERLDKVLDVRVTILDNEVRAVALKATDSTGKQRLDIRRNNMIDVQYSAVKMPSMVKEATLRLLRRYELRFAALDFAIVADESWAFLEINPNGQWAWLDLEAGADIASLFVNALRL